MKKKLPFDFGDMVCIKNSELPIMVVRSIRMNDDKSFHYFCTEVDDKGESKSYTEYGPFSDTDIELYKEKKK